MDPVGRCDLPDPECAAILEQHRARLKKHCEENNDNFFNLIPFEPVQPA